MGLGRACPCATGHTSCWPSGALCSRWLDLMLVVLPNRRRIPFRSVRVDCSCPTMPRPRSGSLRHLWPLGPSPKRSRLRILSLRLLRVWKERIQLFAALYSDAPTDPIEVL